MLQCTTQYKSAVGCSMTGSKSNPPIEAEQTNLNGFLPSFYWPDCVSNLSTPHCGSGEEMAEHLLLSCPRWAAESQRHFGYSMNYMNLVEFLISLGHL